LDLPSGTRVLYEAGWRPSTEDRYERAWQSFKRHLCSSSVSLDQVGVTHVMNYLTLLHSCKLSYSTINLHRSAISMTLAYIDRAPIGSYSHHPSRQGCLHQKTPITQSSFSLGPSPSHRHFYALVPSSELRPAHEEVHLHLSNHFR
jgi:hypothetical protein